MPPQQGQNLLDFGNGPFDFRAHCRSFFAAPRLAEPRGWINRAEPIGSARQFAEPAQGGIALEAGQAIKK